MGFRDVGFGDLGFRDLGFRDLGFGNLGSFRVQGCRFRSRCSGFRAAGADSDNIQ